MQVAFRVGAIVGVITLGTSSIACVGSGDAEATRDTSAALGFAQAAPPPEKRNLRLANPRGGCVQVSTAAGTWTGVAIDTPVGKSRVFCTYTWSSKSGAAADYAALDAIAKKNAKQQSYVVKEVRAPNAVPPMVTFQSESLTFTAQPSSSSSSSSSGSVVFVGAGGNGFTTIGGGGTQAGGSLDLMAEPDTDPEGVPGCDICGEVIGNDWMFFVLPSSALYAPSVTLYTSTTQYNLGAVSTPVFYTPMPATYDGYYYMGW